MIDFFTKEEGDQIIESIRKAELKTSGEIRVHLEDDSTRGTFEDAIEIFDRLGMKETKQRNGVLFLLIPERKEFSIYGDAGIHNVVPDGYWSDVMMHVQDQFRQGAFALGVCEGVDMIGEKLKEFFPYSSEDINELPNEISYRK